MRRLARVEAGLRLAICAVAVGVLTTGVSAAETAKPAVADKAAPAKAAHDVVTFRNGRVVEGEVLSEDGATVRMRVVVAGISTETTYNKADILSITRAERPAADAAKDATVKTTTPAPGNTASGASATPAPSGATPAATPGVTPAPAADGAKVVLLTLKGQFGLEVSQSPIKRALEDAATLDADAVVVKIDSTQDERVGFNGLFRAEKILPVFEEAIAKGQRVVFWVKSAQVGAAFLPFVSREIYFLSDGRMGGIGTLQDFNIGDKRVNEKQISLRLGHAEGVAIAGGYAPELVRAMARADYWLSVKFEGGEPLYKCDLSPPTDEEKADGWTVLSDNGEGNNKDSESDEVRGTSNDVLNLNAEWAQRLRVSKGTADDLDALVFQMGLGTQYTKAEGRGQKILDEWATRVKDARDNFRRTRERVEKMQAKPDEDQETFIGRRINGLREMRSILATYEEVFDPEGEQRAELDLQIDQLRQQLAEVSKAKRQQQQQR